MLALPLPNCMMLDVLCGLNHPLPSARCPLGHTSFLFCIFFLPSSGVLCPLSSFCLKSPRQHIFMTGPSLLNALPKCPCLCPRAPPPNHRVTNQLLFPFIALILCLRWCCLLVSVFIFYFSLPECLLLLGHCIFHIHHHVLSIENHQYWVHNGCPKNICELPDSLALNLFLGIVSGWYY